MGRKPCLLHCTLRPSWSCSVRFPKNAQVSLTEYEPCRVDFVRGYVPYPTVDAEAVSRAAELINNAKSRWHL